MDGRGRKAAGTRQFAQNRFSRCIEKGKSAVVCFDRASDMRQDKGLGIPCSRSPRKRHPFAGKKHWTWRERVALCEANADRPVTEGVDTKLSAFESKGVTGCNFLGVAICRKRDSSTSQTGCAPLQGIASRYVRIPAHWLMVFGSAVLHGRCGHSPVIAAASGVCAGRVRNGGHVLYSSRWGQ